MSVFSDPYLAESVGYNNGHARGISAGIDIGIKRGYIDGWNEATAKGNAVIDELNAGAARLRDENDRLAEKNQQLIEYIQLMQEQAQAMQADQENMRMAFLGVVSVAAPAMKAVAKLPLQERIEIRYEHARQAVALQSDEYIDAHGFPQEQPLILKYLPIARQVFDQTYDQMKRLNAEKNAGATA